MKWLGRVLYIVMIFFVGMLVLMYNNSKQLNNYYKEYAIEYLKENNREEYIEHFMTSKLIREYLKEPVYNAISEDETFPFEIALYHAKVQSSNDDASSFILIYFNELGIDLENVLEEYEEYEKNKENAIILVKLKLEGVEEEFNIPVPLNVEDRTTLHLLEMSKDDSDKDIFKVDYRDESGRNYSEKSTLIERINVSILDATKGREKDQLIESVFARFEHNKDAIMSGTEQITEKEIYTDEALEEDFEVLISKNFNGSTEQYVKEDLYEDENNLGVYHEEKLEPFMKKAKNSLYWYSLVVVIITYLVFFLNPTINYFRNKSNSSGSSNKTHETSSDEFQNFKITGKSDKEQLDNNEPAVKDVIVDPEIKEIAHEKEEVKVINYDKLTVRELKELAKEKNLTGYSKLNKKELIEFIKNNE